MSEQKITPILVTGAHRSGSTWAGNMISAPPDIAYVNEPFNILYKPGSCRPHFQYWYSYVCEENESFHAQYIKDCLEYKPRQFKKALKHGSISDIPRITKFQLECLKAKLMNKRPLVKDPLAVFSSEWLANRFNMDVVILIRHPAAFVGSLKVANWPFSFSHLLNQPLLIEQQLSSYENEIKEFSENEYDLIDQAILLWNLVYSVVLKFQTTYKGEWIFVKHEDLSRDPLNEFRSIFQKLDIPFSEQAESRITKYSYADSNTEDRSTRDSKSNIWKWTTRLTEDEISRVREKTHDISKHFYRDEDWVG